MFSYITSKKLLLCACGCLCFCVFMLAWSQSSSLSLTFEQSPTESPVETVITGNVSIEEAQRRRDNINNTAASVFIAKYEALFNTNKVKPVVEPDPNKPETITTWWQAAAMIDWYINTPLRYHCKRKISMGNWHICQDEPYKIKPPCLVYSFGINWDFSFDDDMAKLGCEVHSFDPSMNLTDHKRGDRSTFHNLGLGSTSTDGFVARQDMYVKGKSVWKMRTVKAIMEMLGHENRVIDVFKMDVEGYEWAVLQNMIETDVFKHIRQYMLEYHLFANFPLFEEYVYIYKTGTRLREMGFREFGIGPHPKTLDIDKFNNQGDTEYINAFFEKQKGWL